MLVDYDSGTGDVIVDYTPACDAADHTIYRGSLGSVSGYGLSDAECNVGTSGTASFTPGAGDWFFMIVGNNGSSEGSYGTDSYGAERPADLETTSCDIPQDLASTCAP